MPYILSLVRVTADDFVAGFETDGEKVRAAAPILKTLVGLTNDQARQIIKAKGWHAAIVTSQPFPPKILQHEESFEVLSNGRRAFFYFDENPGRRAVNGRPDKATAYQQAQAYLASDTVPQS